MPAVPAIRLVSAPSHDVDSYLFDRRRETRRQARGVATGFVTPRSGGVLCRMQRFELVDTSDRGVGLTSAKPVVLGDRVGLSFTGHGSESINAIEGEVVRCVATQGGYRIGLMCDAPGPTSRAS